MNCKNMVIHETFESHIRFNVSIERRKFILFKRGKKWNEKLQLLSIFMLQDNVGKLNFRTLCSILKKKED